MKKSQFALVAGLFFVVIFGLLALLPQRDILFYQLGKFLGGTWYFVYNLVLMVWMLIGSALLGFLAKAYLINFIDNLFWKNEQMEDWMRHTFFVIFAIIIFLLWVVTVPLLMQSWNFLWVAATSLGWSGVFETPPIWWGVWAVIPFWFAWGNTDHTSY